MDPVDPFAPICIPTAARPLLGLTVLVVEDSRVASEAMRLLCQRSGARARRADSLAAARRHLRVYRPTVAVIDLGLPDGSGIELLEELNRAVLRVPVLIAISGDDDAEAMALAAGADRFLAKPVARLGVFQEAVLSALPPDRRPAGPRSVSRERVAPDALAFHEDMAHAADVLSETGDDRALDYVAQFLRGVARSALDSDLLDAVQELAQMRGAGGVDRASVARVAGMVQDRLSRPVPL